VSEVSRRRTRNCRILCVGCALSIPLLLCLAILGYWLYSVRNGQELSLFGINFTSFRTSFVWSSDGQDGSHPIIDAHSEPAVSPTISSMQTIDYVRDTIVMLDTDHGTATKDLLHDESSLQYSVLQWLASDPNIHDYPSSKILQRYALGCFYKNLESSNVEKHISDSWMTYTDECTSWKTTGDSAAGEQLCNENGHVASIYLENAGLSGPLAPELSLLSNSLEIVQLSSNSINGPIPSEIGLLSELFYVNLANNVLTGDIPNEMALLESLWLLRLEGNMLGGSVPQKLCNLTNANTEDESGGLAISVDCEEVTCSCCLDCCFYCGLEPAKGDGVTETSVQDENIVPSSSPTDVSFPVVDSASSNFSCYTVTTGFSCYSTNYAIDFATTSCSPSESDLVAVFQTDDVSASFLSLGSTWPMPDTLYWATSCGLDECDGVVADSKIYYRNGFPDKSGGGILPWPFGNDESYQLAVIQVDGSGTATVVAASEPFIVAAQC